MSTIRRKVRKGHRSLTGLGTIASITITLSAALAIVGCGSGKAPLAPPSEGSTPAADSIGERIFLDPRFSEYFATHMTGINAVELSRRLQPYQLFFLEDVLAPEQIQWYRQIRQICTTPQAVGEVFSHPYEYLPLITERLIDFVRCRVSATGGITPIKKVTTLCEVFGVKTAFQEGGENDPVNQLAAYHVDISTSAFGIQEENAFPPQVHEMMPGAAQIRKGYMYGSGKPGLGIDINEQIAAKYPLGEIRNGGAYPTDRTLDGAVVRP